MPGHDEKTIRKARQDEAASNNPAMGETGMGGTGRTGDIGAGGGMGDPLAADLDEQMRNNREELVEGGTSGSAGVGGIGGTGMTNAEQGSGGQNRMTTGIGAAGDQTDEEILEDR